MVWGVRTQNEIVSKFAEAERWPSVRKCEVQILEIFVQCVVCGPSLRSGLTPLYILIFSCSLSFWVWPTGQLELVGGVWTKLYNPTSHHHSQQALVGMYPRHSQWYPVVSSPHNGDGWALASINIVTQTQRFIIVLKYFSVCEEIFAFKPASDQ